MREEKDGAMGFRNNRQHLRTTRSMTQEQLAMLQGVSRQPASKWEAERTYPEMDKLLLLSAMHSLLSRNTLLDHGDRYFRKRPWVYWRNIIIYFCASSVIGHWLEIGYSLLIRLNVLPGTYDPSSQIWSDWFSPFCVYGFGSLACVLLLFPIKNSIQRHFSGQAIPLILSFIVNALICTGIEFAYGMIFNQPLLDGTLPLWDYSEMGCNFMGQVCLQSSIAFGIVSTLVTWVVYPGVNAGIDRVSPHVIKACFGAVVVVFPFLLFLLFR